jgi:hypothetical protein
MASLKMISICKASALYHGFCHQPWTLRHNPCQYYNWIMRWRMLSGFVLACFDVCVLRDPMPCILHLVDPMPCFGLLQYVPLTHIVRRIVHDTSTLQAFIFIFPSPPLGANYAFGHPSHHLQHIHNTPPPHTTAGIPYSIGRRTPCGLTLQTNGIGNTLPLTSHASRTSARPNAN